LKIKEIKDEYSINISEKGKAGKVLAKRNRSHIVEKSRGERKGLRTYLEQRQKEKM
jgi:hypothetical protein